MTLRLFFAACSLLAAAACATPTQRAQPQTGREASAAAGDVLTAAPGEAIYSETSTRFEWTLSFDADTQVGPYTVEAGDYPLTGLSRDGYFFAVGDDCAGEPAVISTSRFADAPEHLLITADEAQTCVVPAFDQARCTPRTGAMRYERTPGQDERQATLFYIGPGTALDGVTPLARFTLVTETALQRREQVLTTQLPGLLVAANGRFRVIDADDTGAVLLVEQAINEVPEIERPSLDGLD